VEFLKVKISLQELSFQGTCFLIESAKIPLTVLDFEKKEKKFLLSFLDSNEQAGEKKWNTNLTNQLSSISSALSMVQALLSKVYSLNRPFLFDLV
jgi:hypothetical protein